MKKLLTIVNHLEGEDYPIDSIIVVGKLIQQRHVNGVFIVYNSPIKYNTSYINATDFTQKHGTCFNRRIMMIRIILGKISITFNNAVYPIINMELK